MIIVILPALGYLIGGVPTGLLFCKLIKGVDPRAIGSGSTGATNVSRVLGKKWAITVLVIDILKGLIPTILLPKLAGSEQVVMATLLVSTGVITGHVWTPYAGFRGGKGVATATGALIAIDGIAVLLGAGLWLLVFLLFRIVSVASIIAAVSLPFSMALLGNRPLAYIFAGAGIALFIIFTHRQNIARLFKGQEKRL